MNLYLSHGRIWTGTQADAKAAQGGSKDYQSIDVPTDKPGLIAFLNELVNGDPKPSSSAGPGYITDEALVAVAASMPGMALTMPNTDTFAVAPTTSAGNPTPVTPGSCPACNRSKQLAIRSNNSTAVVSIVADLEDVTDAASLDRIIAVAESRKAAL